MKKFWLVRIHPVFEGKDEQTGEIIQFKNWRENVMDVMAESVDHAKEVAALTGIFENEHYHDIVEVKGEC